MATDSGTGQRATEMPDEAFSVLANETRLKILQTLGDAGEPLSFSELFGRIDYDDAPNFNYHLKQLKGHFIADTDDGYQLHLEGRRVIKALRAGFMSETPEVDRTQVETPCFLCGGDQMEVSYRQGSIGVYCSECGGTRDGSAEATGWADDSTTDIIGNVGLPSAGARNRSPTEMLRVGELWSCWMAHALSRDICPECSAPVEHSVTVCEDHDTTDARCTACGRQSGITVTSTCTHCIRDQRYTFAALLLADTDVMAFMIDHGRDPLIPRAFHHAAVEETIVSTDPFEARFTFTADDETLTLTVDEDLSVVDVARKQRANDA